MQKFKSIFESLENIPFSKESFNVCLEALFMMLKGMIGVFTFMLLFYFIVRMLDKFFSKECEDK